MGVPLATNDHGSSTLPFLLGIALQDMRSVPIGANRLGDESSSTAISVQDVAIEPSAWSMSNGEPQLRLSPAILQRLQQCDLESWIHASFASRASTLPDNAMHWIPTMLSGELRNVEKVSTANSQACPAIERDMLPSLAVPESEDPGLS